MVTTIIKYFFVTIEVLGPLALLVVTLLACGFWELSGIHFTIVH
jgi:hypothetical protein